MPQQIVSSHASTLCSGPDVAGYKVFFPSTIGEGDDEVPMELAMWLCTVDPTSFQITGQPDAPAIAVTADGGTPSAEDADLEPVASGTDDVAPVTESESDASPVENDDHEAAGRVADVIAQSEGQSVEDMLAAAEAALAVSVGGAPVDSTPVAPRARGAKKQAGK